MPRKPGYKDIPTIPRICQYCGCEFMAFGYQVRKGQGLFCSRSCGKKDKTGEKHHAFKGGIYLATTGYYYYSSGPHKNRQVHRVMMEQYLGRSLSEHEIVHHKNEVKTDNRIDNFEVMSQSEHMKHHNAKWRGDRWAKDYDYCQRCGSTERKHHCHGFCSGCYYLRQYS